MKTENGPLTLWAIWSVPVDNLKPGDVYTLTINDSRGKALISSNDYIERYTESYPNGPGCPPRCLSAGLDLSPASKSPQAM